MYFPANVLLKLKNFRSVDQFFPRETDFSQSLIKPSPSSYLLAPSSPRLEVDVLSLAFIRLRHRVCWIPPRKRGLSDWSVPRQKSEQISIQQERNPVLQKLYGKNWNGLVWLQKLSFGNGLKVLDKVEVFEREGITLFFFFLFWDETVVSRLHKLWD